MSHLFVEILIIFLLQHHKPKTPSVGLGYKVIFQNRSRWYIKISNKFHSVKTRGGNGKYNNADRTLPGTLYFYKYLICCNYPGYMH